MNEEWLNNLTLKEYRQLKKEVSDLYEKMMALHQNQQRDAFYANSRKAYMEQKNKLQQAMEQYPEYEVLDRKG